MNNMLMCKGCLLQKRELCTRFCFILDQRADSQKCVVNIFACGVVYHLFARLTSLSEAHCCTYWMRWGVSDGFVVCRDRRRSCLVREIILTEGRFTRSLYINMYVFDCSFFVDGGFGNERRVGEGRRLCAISGFVPCSHAADPMKGCALSAPLTPEGGRFTSQLCPFWHSPQRAIRTHGAICHPFIVRIFVAQTTHVEPPTTCERLALSLSSIRPSDRHLQVFGEMDLSRLATYVCMRLNISER